MRILHSGHDDERAGAAAEKSRTDGRRDPRCAENFYRGLKAEERTAIEEALKEATDWQFDYIAQRDKELLEALKKEGMEVTEPDKEAFRTATAPAYDAFYAKFGDDARNFVKAIEGLEAHGAD